jgi:hypothetical protein
MLLLRYGFVVNSEQKFKTDWYIADKHENYRLPQTRLAQYMWDNFVAVLTNRQIIVGSDTMDNILLDSVIHDGVLAIDGCQINKSAYLYVMLYPSELFIANVTANGKLSQ